MRRVWVTCRMACSLRRASGEASLVPFQLDRANPRYCRQLTSAARQPWAKQVGTALARGCFTRSTTLGAISARRSCLGLTPGASSYTRQFAQLLRTPDRREQQPRDAQVCIKLLPMQPAPTRTQFNSHERHDAARAPGWRAGPRDHVKAIITRPFHSVPRSHGVRPSVPASRAGGPMVSDGESRPSRFATYPWYSLHRASRNSVLASTTQNASATSKAASP
jgi:hypothetical protein